MYRLVLILLLFTYVKHLNSQYIWEYRAENHYYKVDLLDSNSYVIYVINLLEDVSLIDKISCGKYHVKDSIIEFKDVYYLNKFNGIKYDNGIRLQNIFEPLMINNNRHVFNLNFLPKESRDYWINISNSNDYRNKHIEFIKNNSIDKVTQLNIGEYRYHNSIGELTRIGNRFHLIIEKNNKFKYLLYGKVISEGDCEVNGNILTLKDKKNKQIYTGIISGNLLQYLDLPGMQYDDIDSRYFELLENNTD